MKHPLVVFFSIAVLAVSAWQGTRNHAEAIPNSFFGNGPFIGPIVPAHPRFGANLTRGFLTFANWENQKLPGPWETTSIAAGLTHHHMTAMPVLFGAVPDSVVAREEKGEIREIVITYLDAGTFFPYLAGGEKSHEQRQSGASRRAEFDSHWRQLERELRQRLEGGCGPGQQSVVGRSDLLRAVYVDFTWDAFRLRLARREGHSIALHLSRSDQPAPTPVDSEVASLHKQARSDWLASHARSNERGEKIIAGIPSFDQGFTPYCGVHALAMVAHYHGLRLLPGELAAGAEFANTGSASGSRTLDLYRAVGEELGLKLSHSSRFDSRRVERSIEKGLPVVVWRRVSIEREKAHADLAARIQNHPDLKLAALNLKTVKALPDRQKKSTPSHASVIHGLNLEDGTVVFLEPWGQDAHDRRMRIEEMEATAYAVFYFEP